MTKKTAEANEKKRRAEVLKRLAETYPHAKPALNYKNAYELLVATILSAQCTDVRVNIVTKDFFPLWPDAASLAAADVAAIEDVIRSCGFYKMKAQHLSEAARRIVSVYGGKVPDTMDELTTLAGVGRKTANVVLFNAFGKPAFAVDTHVFRVSNRMGLVCAKTPEETEKQLCAAVPEENWGNAHHWLIYHGRQVCAARKPKCGECALADICPGRTEQ